MRHFRLFISPLSDSSLEGESISLEDLRKAPGTSNLKELELVKSGSLELKREMEDLHILNFSCEYFGSKPTSAEKRPTHSAHIDIWQPKKQSMIAVFDAPRKIARVGAALLSQLCFRKPFKVQPVDFDVNHFSRLWSGVSGMEGSVTQLIVNNAPIDDSMIKQVQLKGDELEKVNAVKNLLENIGELKEEIEIRYMGFRLKFPGQDVKMHFRIGWWGGGQIYTPSDFLPHEFLRLLDLLEDAYLYTGRDQPT